MKISKLMKSRRSVGKVADDRLLSVTQRQGHLCDGLRCTVQSIETLLLMSASAGSTVVDDLAVFDSASFDALVTEIETVGVSPLYHQVDTSTPIDVIADVLYLDSSAQQELSLHGEDAHETFLCFDRGLAIDAHEEPLSSNADSQMDVVYCDVAIDDESLLDSDSALGQHDAAAIPQLMRSEDSIALQNPAHDQISEVVFIQSGLRDYEALIADLMQNAQGSGRVISVVRLENSTSGLDQIDATLAEFTNLAAIHIVSHGSDGAIQLGNASLSAHNVQQHFAELQEWGHALRDDGDILIYGCDVASSSVGRDLMQALALATGADVAASDDTTGHADLGGDWSLEVQMGQIDTEIAFSIDLQESWGHTLPATTVDLSASQDTYIHVNSSGTNYGASSTLVIDRSGGSFGNGRILLQFDLSSIPTNAIINSATLKLESIANGGAFNVNVYQVTQTWSEGTSNGTAGTANWNQSQSATNWSTAGGTFNGTSIATTSNGATGQHTWSITSLVSDWVSGAASNNGLILATPQTGTTTITYSSREGATVPVLTVDYFVSDPPNQAPAGTNGTVSVAEDSVYTFVTGDFGFTDPNDSPADTLAAVTITTLPSSGQLMLSGGPVTAGQSISAPDIASGNLRFVPAANSNGSPQTSFTFQVQDNGGTASGGVDLDASPNTLSVNITAVNDAPVGLPTITGTVTENQTLTANTSGISDADGLGTFNYQWLRDGFAISGATSSAYTLGDADVASQISVRVGYADGFGTAEQLTSSQTSAVANVNDVPVGIPAITGSVIENQTLTADTSGITDPDGLGAFSYQWLQNGVAISGATSSTYMLGDADVATQISVQIGYVDGNGTTEQLMSTPTAAVVNVNDIPVGLPAITGVATENQTLTADTSGITDTDGLGALSYQWLRNGVAISGATGSSYTLGDTDVATQVSVRVSYVDGNGTAEQLTSTQTAAVANVNDVPVGLPAITGVVTENQTLTAETSGITDTDGLGIFNYQWLRDGVAISGATSNVYTLGAADVATQISVRVSYVDGNSTTEQITSTPTAAVANVNDAPSGLPAIIGTVAENQTLTSDTSSISDADGLGTFNYQWLRNGVAISGAISSTYTLGDADVATQMSVRVSYVDGNGTTEQLTTTQTAAVVNVNDVPVGLPAINGTVLENQTLTANTSGISDADGLATFSYQWLRNGAAIFGATSSTYTLADADVATQISVQVRYIDGNGTTEQLTSTPTAAVANVNDAPVGLPTISGVVTENQTLTADTSGITDADGLSTFSYQWLRNGVAISGATSGTYTLGDADVARQISLRVSYIDGNGTAEQMTSAQTVAVANVNDAPVGLPAITGTFTENQTLTANTSSISDADGLGALSYQWLRNGVAISGATGSTYTLGDLDVATQFSVQVGYVDGNGTTELLTSTQTAAVVNVNDVPVGVATIVGTSTEDQTLTAGTAGISDADGLGVFSYQWLRNGVAISGATGNTYTLGDADVTTQVSVQVSYVDVRGTSESVTAAATAPVANVNDAPTISAIGNSVFDVSDGSGLIGFNVADNDNLANGLTIEVTSSDQSTVPLSSIILSGTGSNRTIEFQPGLRVTFGPSTITIIVSDGITSSSTSFVVTTLGDSSKGIIDSEAGGGSSDTDDTGSEDSGATAGDDNSASDGSDNEDDVLNGNAGTLEIMHFTDGTGANGHGHHGHAPLAKDGVERLLNEIRRELSKILVEISDANGTLLVADRQPPELNEELLALDAVPEDVTSGGEYQLVSISDVQLQLDTPTEQMEFDPEAAADDADQTVKIHSAGSAMLTVIAAGAMSAMSKGTAVGVLGINTTTNNFVYIASNGKRVAVRTFEALVTQFTGATGKWTTEALACEQIRSSGIVSSGTELSLQAMLAATASSVPLWCAFDPLVILDRFASEYGPPDAAEQRSLASIVAPSRHGG